MAIPLAPGGKGAPARAPLPVAPTNIKTGANPRGVAVTAAPAKLTVNDVAAKTLGTGANPRGVAIKQPALKGTTYKQAVVETFLHQPDPQKTAIVQGALHSPSAEGKIVLDYLRSHVPAGLHLNLQAGTGKKINAGPTLWQDIAHGFTQGTGIGMKASSGGKSVTGMTGGAIPGIGTVLPFSGPKGPLQVAKNFGNDAWNYAPGTVEGLYGVGKDVVTGHEGNAFHALIDPYIQLAEHPAQTFYEHPGNTAAMLMAPKAIIGKTAGAIARSGALGEDAAAAASTARAPLHIGTVAGEPSPILEARGYSNDAINKAFQVAHEKVLRAKGLNPNVAREAPKMLPKSVAQSLNVGMEAKLRRVADEMTSTRQALGRQDRARVLNDLGSQAPKGVARNLVGHVLQGVIRSPETAVEDASKEINRLKAAQTGKRTVGEIWNRNQVKDLSTALKTPGALDAAFKAAEKIRPQINAQDASLVAHGLLDPEQALRSKLQPYAMAHMGAKYDPISRTFVNADGSTLSMDAILSHLKENGVPDPAYVGHFPGKVSPARFYSTYRAARGTLGNKVRTGEAFRTGAYDHTFEGLVGQVASRAEAVTKAELHDKVVNRLGIKFNPTQTRTLMQAAGLPDHAINDAIKTGAFTPKEAQLVARAAMVDDHGNQIPGALELTPISMAPKSAMAQVADLQHPSELQNVSQVELQALSHAITDAATRTDQTRNVTLIPRIAAQRFAQQFSKTDSLLKGVGRVTQQFRRTVLPYSTHWMMQIGSEAALRSLLAGINPRDLVDGRALMSHLEDTPAGRAALQEMVNATFYNKRDPLAIHNPNPGMLSGAAHAFPPTRALIFAHNRYADMIGGAMASLEHQARVAGLGHFAHAEAQSFAHSWSDAVRLQGKSVAQLGERLKADPALVAKFGRQIDDTFGKYNKFSPAQRAMVQSFMPFLPWYLNAAKYVLVHLPAHHPVSTALLASLRQTINQDTKDGKSLPLNAYSMQNLARISPFGIFTPPSSHPSTGAALAGQQMTGAFLPQIEGSLYNLAGVNSFGSGALKEPPSGANYKGDTKPLSGPALAAAAENMLEAFLPGVRYAREALAGGRSTYGTSSILSPQPKPGAKGGSAATILNRIFNPLYAFEAAKGKGPAFNAKPGAPYGNAAGSSSNGKWSVVQSNPAGTHTTNDKWTVVSP